ncbi:MAG: replication-associated recombination protein A [Elusimicrobiota bacterium]
MEKIIEQKNNNSNLEPLAYRMRPDSLKEFTGQHHLIKKGKKLRRMIDSKRLFSIILYGPPGCGKSALSHVIVENLDADVEEINAVNSGVSDLRKISKKGRMNFNQGKRTVLVIDEIHRFSKNQQEALLPDVEKGILSIIGITTENPFYFVVGPLLSRTNVFKLEPLSKKEIKKILKNSITSKKGFKDKNIKITEEACDIIADTSNGDARYALNILELAVHTTEEVEGEINIDKQTAIQCMGRKKHRYDKKGDEHYNTISAFIKSMRGSDPDAAVYYLAKMIISGEDPRFIARRIAICASEDVGNADPRALMIANAALNAVEYVGMPESQIILTQAAVYIACSPKSNASCSAINSAIKFVEKRDRFSVPVHLTKTGSKKYKYPHKYKYGYVEQKYMEPEKKFYFPTNRGHEKYIRKYLDFISSNGK